MRVEIVLVAAVGLRVERELAEELVVLAEADLVPVLAGQGAAGADKI